MKKLTAVILACAMLFTMLTVTGFSEKQKIN